MVDLFYFKKYVSLAFLEDMDRRSTGCHEDFEYIRVRVYKMSEVADILTSSALIGVKLVERALKCVF